MAQVAATKATGQHRAALRYAASALRQHAAHITADSSQPPAAHPRVDGVPDPR